MTGPGNGLRKPCGFRFGKWPGERLRPARRSSIASRCRPREVVLLGRLQEAEPDRFSRAHLRTLQRRVQQWRGIMAQKLVYATAGEPMAEPAAMPELALVGGTLGAKVSVTFLNEATGYLPKPIGRYNVVHSKRIQRFDYEQNDVIRAVSFPHCRQV